MQMTQVCPSPFWSVYTDASVVPNPGRMRIGGIAYSPEGHSSSFSLLLNRTGCNNEAEAWAAIHALEWLATHHAQHVVLYTDNSILVEQLSLPKPKQIVRLAAVYEQARSTLQRFASVQICWIPRHKNTLADALARGLLPVQSDGRACQEEGGHSNQQKGVV